MNKSKFLKKSLAAVLAVLLIVAMIPLSAAAVVYPQAPVPDMTRLYIGGNTAATQNAVKADSDGVFTADIADDATSIYLRADSTSLGTANVNEAKLYVMNYVPATKTEVLSTGVGTQIMFSTAAEDPDAEVVTLNLRLISTKMDASYQEFTVKLKRSSLKTTANLTSVERIQSSGMYTAVKNDAEQVINVEVGRAAGATSGSKNPSIYLTTADKATVAAPTSAVIGKIHDEGGGKWRVDNVVDGMAVTVVSQSGSNTAEWTFKVTKVDSLDSFSLNGVAGVITDSLKADFSTAGSDGVVDTVTVALDKDVFIDKFGKDITTGKVLPVSYAVRGNVGKIIVEQNAPEDVATAPTTKTPESGQIAVASGEDYTLGASPTVGTSKEYTLFVPSGDDGTKVDYQKYRLVIKIKESDNTAIESVIINKEIATINGDSIHAVLPVIQDDGTTENNITAITEITLVTDDTVKKVHMDSNGGTNFFTTSPTTANGKKTWVAASGNPTANLTPGKTILTLTAENGEIKQYDISAEINRDTQLAKLESLVLKAPDGTRYDGVISGHKITFNNIPYMTTSLASWEVYATPNSSATAKICAVTTDHKDHVDTTDADVTIVNGATRGNDIFANITGAPGRTRTYPGKTVVAENKNAHNVFTEYDVELVLVAPKTGNTLAQNGLTVSARTAAPTGQNNEVYDGITTANTINAKIEKDPTGNTGKIILEQPFSLSRANSAQSAGIYDVITKVSTIDGGVAYIGELSNGDLCYVNMNAIARTSGKLSSLPDNKNPFSSHVIHIRKTNGTWGKLRIVVLPEEAARTVSYTKLNDKIAAADLARGTVYTVEDKALSAEHAHELTSIAVKDTNLRIENGKIVGTLPYSLTAKNYSTLDPATFLTFKTNGNFTYWQTNYASDTDAKKLALAYSDGDDGTGDVGTNNLKFLFVRENGHKVSVYTTEDGSSATRLQAVAADDSTTDDSFYIKAEDTLDTNSDYSTFKYTFDLKWADPNTEAKILSFSVGGSQGTISGQNVTVSVPFLTNLKGMIPTFTLSSGATLSLDDASKNGIESGKTTLDFSNPVKVLVTAEDRQETAHYTITVKEGEMFTDVKPANWFYSEVVRAATLGWVNGKGNGIFDPYGTMTRAEFANIIAKTQNFDASKYPDSRFADVDSSHYASAAIAFCADNNYINGVGNGNFAPSNPITREQAATIICRVMGYEEQSGNTNYADDAKISSWAKGAVKAATENKVFEGDGTNFNPQKNLQRCQGAAILVRAIDK